MKKSLLLLFPILAITFSGCNNSNSNNEPKQDEPEIEPVGPNIPEEKPEPEPITKEYEWKYVLDFSKCNFVQKEKISISSLNISEDIKFNFTGKGSGDFKTAAYNNCVRFYKGNSFVIVSETTNLTKIEFTFGSNDKNNEITANPGSFNGSTWNGDAKEIDFSILGSSGYREIATISVFFKKTEQQPAQEDPINPTAIDLGTKTISEVKQYISENPVQKNLQGNGVNQNVLVTIKGKALAKIDLIKEKSEFGLNVSNPAKVIVGDETDWIGCACKTGQGSLWYKIDDYTNKDTSKYKITGYISEYLGHPELQVISYSWESDMDLDVNVDNYASEISISDFYTNATNVNYNCAGHGYGDVYTIKGLTCYYVEADGNGKRYYNFTDGESNIRVNAFNIPNATVGKTYDITGIISLKNCSPIIVAFSIKSSQNSPVSLDYIKSSTLISIENLKKIYGSQDDTNNRYPDLIYAYGEFYKTTGYLVVVEEGYKYYIGISDTYYDHVITGKINAITNYNIALIKNDGFWNTTEEKLALFNSYYDEYIFENNPVDIYYVVRQQEYSSGKAGWEILLVPSSIPELEK